VKSNGAVVLFGSQPFTSKLVASNIEWFKYEWIWDKVMVTNIAAAKIQPLRTHENILVFSNGTPTYNPTFGKAKKPFGKLSETISKVVTSSCLGTDYQVGVGYPKTILTFHRPNNLTGGGLHPTQKPVDLLAYLIRTYTNPGEIILDNTMGSGTTLVAAQREGRRAIGIDISEEYCAIAVDRLRQPSFFSIPDKPKAKPAEQLSLSLK
jgi:site-specific DNA-methyltransferase (adenine-specific)